MASVRGFLCGGLGSINHFLPRLWNPPPCPPLNPLISALSSLTPGRIMKLGGMDEISVGADLAEEMLIRIEGWADQGQTLKLSAPGHRLSLRSPGGSQQIRGECSCQEPGASHACEHILAALITFSGLLKNGTISHRPPRYPELALDLLQRLHNAPSTDPATALPPPSPSPRAENAERPAARRDDLRFVADGKGFTTVRTSMALIMRGGGKWARVYALQDALAKLEARDVIEALAKMGDDFNLVLRTEDGEIPFPPVETIRDGVATIDIDWQGDHIVCTPKLQFEGESPEQDLTISSDTQLIQPITAELAIADGCLVRVLHADVWDLHGIGHELGWQPLGRDISEEEMALIGAQVPGFDRPLRPLRQRRVPVELWRRLQFNAPFTDPDDPDEQIVHFLIDGQPTPPLTLKATPVVELTTRDPWSDASSVPSPPADLFSGKAVAASGSASARLGMECRGQRLEAGFSFLIRGMHEGFLFARITDEPSDELDPKRNPLKIVPLDLEGMFMDEQGEWDDSDEDFDEDDDPWDFDDGDEDDDEDEDPDDGEPDSKLKMIPDFDEQGQFRGPRPARVSVLPEFADRTPLWRFESVNGSDRSYFPQKEEQLEMMRLWWAHLDALALEGETDPEQLRLDLPHLPLILTRRASESDCPLSWVARPVVIPIDAAATEGGKCWASVGDLPEAAMRAMRVATPMAASEFSLWKKNNQPAAWWPVQPRRLTDRLPELLELASMHDTRVSMDAHPVEYVDLDIKLEALEIDDRPDWFALRPEVAWSDFRLDDHEWVQLLTGGLIRDGRILMAGDTARERLRALDLVLGGRRGARPGSSGDDEEEAAPRLRMFDWLELRRLGVEVTMPPDITRLIERLAAPDTIEPVPVPAGLKADMRPYQERGYQWLAFLYTQRFGACLADDMGLGKTLQAIALLAGLHEGVVPAQGTDRRPHLIVLPPTLVFNWQAELRRFYPRIEVIEYRGRNQSIRFPRGSVVLTTYDQVRLRIDDLAQVEFDCLIFDEAQAAKNWTSQRAKAARRLQARFRMCLTGTPLENHIGEYHSIMELALPGLFGDRREFLTTVKEDDERAAMLVNRARPFVMRRTKNLILKELPPKIETEIALPCDPVQREMYTRTVAEVRADIAEAYKLQTQAKAGIKALSALMRLRQICISPALLDPAHRQPSPKLTVLAEKLAELLEESQAALVFSQFTSALDEVGKVLAAESIPYQRLDGSTPKPKRRQLVEAFQDGSGPGVFLISLKTGGAGLNLTRASHVFHLDPWWNPAVEHQATDRAHRIGQTGTVFVHRLIMQHTIEESMMVLKQRKQAVYDRIMRHAAGLAARGTDGTGETTRSALLTREDFEFLLNPGDG